MDNEEFAANFRRNFAAFQKKCSSISEEMFRHFRRNVAAFQKKCCSISEEMLRPPLRNKTKEYKELEHFTFSAYFLFILVSILVG